MDAFDDGDVVHVHVPLSVDGHYEDEEEPFHISETFLHDLEAFFLVRDSKPATDGPAFDMDPVHSTPSKQIKHASSLTPRRLSRPPSNLCSTVSGPTCSTPLPRSVSASTCYALTSSSLSPPGCLGASSSIPASSGPAFIRRTCSAFKLRGRHLGSASPLTAGTTNSGSKSCSPFPSRTRAPVLTALPGNVTVSVSMGPSASSRGGIGNRSLQSHSVRDLSVVGTISSDMKKRIPVSRSGSSSKGR